MYHSLLTHFDALIITNTPTDFCYECLPPYVFALSRTEKVKFDNFCDALQEVDALQMETREDKDLAKWVFNIVTTRSFGDANEKKIIPMGDMVRCPSILLQ